MFLTLTLVHLPYTPGIFGVSPFYLGHWMVLFLSKVAIKRLIFSVKGRYSCVRRSLSGIKVRYVTSRYYARLCTYP